MEHIHVIIEDFVERAMQQRSHEDVTRLLTEFMRVLHEVSYKDGPEKVLLGLRFGLGDEAAWHYFGMIHNAYSKAGYSPNLWDEAGSWHNLNADAFSPMIEQWRQELSKGAQADEDPDSPARGTPSS